MACLTSGGRALPVSTYKVEYKHYLEGDLSATSYLCAC